MHFVILLSGWLGSRLSFDNLVRAEKARLYVVSLSVVDVRVDCAKVACVWRCHAYSPSKINQKPFSRLPASMSSMPTACAVCKQLVDQSTRLVCQTRSGKAASYCVFCIMQWHSKASDAATNCAFCACSSEICILAQAMLSSVSETTNDTTNDTTSDTTNDTSTSMDVDGDDTEDDGDEMRICGIDEITEKKPAATRYGDNPAEFAKKYRWSDDKHETANKDETGKNNNDTSVCISSWRDARDEDMEEGKDEFKEEDDTLIAISALESLLFDIALRNFLLRGSLFEREGSADWRAREAKIQQDITDIVGILAQIADLSTEYYESLLEKHEIIRAFSAVYIDVDRPRPRRV